MIHCYICYSTSVEEDCVCDRCDEYYCSECSYTFEYYYQHEGTRCHWCADQSRRKPLTKEMIRENKLKLIGL